MSETSHPIGCVIMASGLARRFGSNKLLADFGGRPLLCRALDATDTPQLACRIVVTRSAEVETLCQTLGVACLRHALPGRNDTVRLGLEALLTLQPGLAGCIFLPGDQPLLRRETVEALVCAFVADTRTQKETERAIFRLAFQAENDPEPLVGSPALFGCGYFSGPAHPARRQRRQCAAPALPGAGLQCVHRRPCRASGRRHAGGPAETKTVFDLKRKLRRSLRPWAAER